MAECGYGMDVIEVAVRQETQFGVGERSA